MQSAYFSLLWNHFIKFLLYSKALVQKGGDSIMEKIMNKYETIFVIDASLADEDINALTEKFKALIEANGTIDSVDVWGKRKLAYEINFKSEGYYVLINFSSEAEFITELNRVYNITDGLLRTIVIKK